MDTIKCEYRGGDSKCDVLDTVVDGFWKVDVNGKVLYVNDNYSKLSLYSPAELLNKYIWDFDANETEKEVMAHINGIMTSGGYDRFKTRHKKKDGTIWDVEITVKYIDSGYLIVFLRDITEEENIKNKLEDQSLQFEKMVELFDMASNKSGKPQIITTEDFEVLFINGFAAKLLGVNIRSIRDKNILPYLGLEHVEGELRDILESTHFYEKITTVNDKAIYIRIRALYNTIVKGYAFYPASYDLMQDLEKLRKLGYINE